MTINEKRNALHDYCEGRGCTPYTDKCPFYDSSCDFDEMSDTMINDAYTLAFPESVESVAPNDPVNHPSHYTNGMECIDEMVLIFGKYATMVFCKLNAWKYRKRALYKNGEEDMKKSDWYIAKYKELNDNGKPLQFGEYLNDGSTKEI